jgi:HEAT repeat protein
MLIRFQLTLAFLALATIKLDAQAPTPPAAPPAAAAPQTWPTVIAGKDLAGWIKEMKESPDGAVREMAVKAIPLFGPSARSPALRPLIQQLSRETDPGVKINIVLVLGQIGAEKPEEAKMIVEALNGLLGSTSPGSPFRLHVIRSMTMYGPTAALAIPLMKNHAADPAWETRQAVAMSLGRIGQPTDPKKGPSKPALDVLAERLGKEECAAVRLEIAQSMVLLGVPAYQASVSGEYEKVVKPYFDAVTKKLEVETDPATRVWLLVALMRYDGHAFNDTTISKIADAINGKDIGGRIAALRALALLPGDKSKAALPSMLAALKFPEPELVVEAMVALAAMKTFAKDALPELERIKAGQDEYLKQVATAAIDIISGKKNPAAPAPAPAAPPPKK